MSAGRFGGRCSAEVKCRSAVVVGLLMLGVGGRAACAPSESRPVFRFHPPDKTARIEKVKTTQLLEVQGQAAPARESEVAERVEIVRATDGWMLRSKLISGTTRGGSAQAQVLYDALKGATLAYVIDGRGQVQSVEGVEGVLARATKSVPAEVKVMLERALAPDSMVQGLKADWDRLVGDLVGRPASVGASWVSQQQYASPDGGLVNVHVATKVVGRVRTQGHDCLRLTNVFGTSPEDLRPFLGASAKALLAGLKPLGGSTRVSGSSELVTDPATLIWYQAASRLKMETTIQVPGRGPVQAVVTRIKQHRTEPLPTN